MFLIIVSWAGLIVLGCAIVYDQRLSSFRTVAGLASPQSPSFFEAWNISLGSLISLAGESVPPNRWLRLLMSIEALIGLGLVTASVSWLLSVYPIVESRRTLARFANSLKSAAERDDWQTKWLAESSAAYILVSLTRDLAAVRTETAQFPIAYYFSVRHPESELAVALPFIDDLASQAGNTIYSGTTRVAGKILGMQVSDYLKLLAVTFLRMSAESQPEEILASYMEDHFQIKANP
ncbi:MAG TPA: hypothetical protein VJ731_14480 [Terriglobales bacterium]|nr:hypothetical protein [Terriglobales bacterium]